MKTATIETINKRIAEYMGYELVRVGYFGNKDIKDEDCETKWQVENEGWCDKVGLSDVGEYFVNINENKFISKEDCNYCSDWNSLMEVINKMENEDVGRGVVLVEICGHRTVISFNDERITVIAEITAHQCNSKIESTYLAVYDYITK